MKNLLIVDDEEGIRENLKYFFMKEYNVFLASDGQLAWEVIQNNKIDMIISDMSMPKLNGCELANKVFYYNDQIPLIFLSGLDKDDQTPYPNNVYKFVEKPFKLKDIFEAVQLKIG
jgi:DNA-binding NtrC family response regulator